jgi:radical SAM protein with 4Fe4S-binding SPASM domain
MSSVPTAPRRTTYAVWEITLKCNLACNHCGSRAGDARVDELTTEECLDLVRQMDEIGIDEVTLIGGEAYLRRDWLTIARAIVERGMICSVTSGGLSIKAEMARQIFESGINSVSISVDGLKDSHDALRGVPGSWDACFRALKALTDAGVQVTANTQINRRSMPELPALYENLRDAGIGAWQIMMTVPMGNAADNADILLQPYELLELFPLLGDLALQAQRDGIVMASGNNIGYYGPYDQLLLNRGQEGLVYYTGCEAGTQALGIEADGKIKGCPSLPSGPYTGANIRDMSLAEIMAYTEPLQMNKAPRFTDESVAHLWGFCGSCEFAKLCRSGCQWTAHVFFGKRGNNPYCHHRALEFDRQGLRERVIRKEEAPGLPFDNGVFESVVEPKDAPFPAVRWLDRGDHALDIEVQDGGAPWTPATAPTTAS